MTAALLGLRLALILGGLALLWLVARDCWRRRLDPGLPQDAMSFVVTSETGTRDLVEDAPHIGAALDRWQAAHPGQRAAGIHAVRM